MIPQLRDFVACERGNVYLRFNSGDDGFNFYAALPKGGWMETTYRPDNYPQINMAALDMNDAALAAHINAKLQGMYVTKGNIDGLNIDETGCIRETSDE